MAAGTLEAGLRSIRGAQGGFDLKGDGAVARVRDGEGFGVAIAEGVAGGEVVEFAAGFQDEGAEGGAGDKGYEGLEGVFEVAEEQGVEFL